MAIFELILEYRPPRLVAQVKRPRIRGRGVYLTPSVRPLGKPFLVEIRHILAPFGCFMGPRKMGFGGILYRLQTISIHSRIISKAFKK